jgi:hypothetical protein
MKRNERSLFMEMSEVLLDFDTGVNTNQIVPSLRLTTMSTHPAILSNIKTRQYPSFNPHNTLASRITR